MHAKYNLKILEKFSEGDSHCKEACMLTVDMAKSKQK